MNETSKLWAVLLIAVAMLVMAGCRDEGEQTPPTASEGATLNGPSVGAGPDVAGLHGNNARTIAIPRITEIRVPSQIRLGTFAIITLLVEGEPNHTLNYQFSADRGFLRPPTGTITLDALGSGEVSITYGTSFLVGIYTHSVQVTDVQGSLAPKVETHFETNVVSIANSGRVNRIVPPQVSKISATRTGIEVTWSATTINPIKAAYSWSWDFQQTGGGGTVKRNSRTPPPIRACCGAMTRRLRVL